MACYKCHQLGHWVALCPWVPRASRSSTKPFLTMVQQDRGGPLQPAHLSQTIITELEPRVQLDVAVRSENFLADTGATYSVLTSYSRAFFLKSCNILGATGKSNYKRFTQALLHCWHGQIFSHQFLVALATPLLGNNLSCLQNLAAISVLIEDALKLSLGDKLTIFTSHRMKQLLNGRGIYGCVIKESSDIK